MLQYKHKQLYNFQNHLNNIFDSLFKHEIKNDYTNWKMKKIKVEDKRIISNI